jgi:hypothetical protein
MTTLRERLADLVALETLVLPPDHDRRGMYAPTSDPAPPRSDDAAPHIPDIGV